MLPLCHHVTMYQVLSETDKRLKNYSGKNDLARSHSSLPYAVRE